MSILPLQTLMRMTVPQIWDNSLTPTEQLAAILAKIDEIIAATNSLLTIDTRQYLEDIITEWIDDGTLAAIVTDQMAVTDTAGYYAVDKVRDMFAEIGLIRANQKIVNVLDEGIAGDGSDETTALQAAIDKAVALNGTLYVPAGVVIVVSYVLITTKSNFRIRCDGWLKRKNAATYPDTYNALFNIVNCYDFFIDSLHVDGNVANNGVTIQEHEHCLEINGCYQFYIHELRGKNLPGDVLYISGSHDLQVTNLFGHSANTGRNTLSIISGYNMQFGNIVSKGVGTSGMPGGVDIEPNVITDDCYNIQFGNVYIEGVGTSLFTITNNPGAIVRDIITNSLEILKSVRVEGSGLRQGIGINKADNIKINSAVIRQNTNTDAEMTMTAIFIDGGDNIEINVDIAKVGIGIRIGFNTAARNIKISGNIYYCQSQGVHLSNCSNVLFSGMIIEDCNVAAGTESHIVFDSGSTFTNVVFQDCKFIKTLYGFNVAWTEGTFANVRFIDCDNIGWSGIAFGGDPGATADFWRINCKGINFAAAMPAAGYWKKGEYVINTSPEILGSEGSRYVTKGWLRITSTTNNVINQDWIADNVLTGT